jgi:hypothetical protein
MEHESLEAHTANWATNTSNTHRTKNGVIIEVARLV